MTEALVADYAALHGVSQEAAKEAMMARMGVDDGDMLLPVSFRPAIVWAIRSHDQLRTVAGLSGIAQLSFDQTAVEAVARMHGIEVTPRVAEDLFVLQNEGLRIMRQAA